MAGKGPQYREESYSISVKQNHFNMASTQGNVGRKVEWIEKLESMPHMNYIFLEGIVIVPYGFIVRATNCRLYLPSEHCKTAGLGTPMYTLFSDRRGN